MANRDAPRARWAGKAPPPPSRWNALVPLSVLIAFGLGLFVYFLIYQYLYHPITHFELIEITKYGDRYPGLGSKSWQEVLPNEPSKKRDIESKEHVAQAIDAIKKKRDEIYYWGDHTLVLVLRCHADMDTQGHGRLLTGEVGDVNHYPVKDFLAKVLDCNFKNTVIVADICDLNYSPSLGYIVNPIVSALQTDCSEIQDKLQNRNLWILCAASDGQPSFRDLSGKTLFQEAVVESLKQIKAKENSFSLADFYHGVRKYCHDHSLGTQTPVWIDAKPAVESQVEDKSRRIARLDFVVPPTESSDKDSSPDKESDQAESALPALPEPIEKTWGVIEKFSTLKIEPAPFQWQPFERDPLVYRQALARQALHELDQLQAKLSPEVAAGINKIFEDASASVAPSEMAPEIRRALEVWENPSQILSKDDAQKWNLVQPELRMYLRDIAHWIAWRDLVFSLPIEPGSGDRFLEDLQNSSKTLADIHARLKLNLLLKDADDQGNASSWLKSITAEDLKEIEKKNDAKWSNTTAALIRNLDSKGKLSWFDEQRIRVALQSPLFTAVQRQVLLGRGSKPGRKEPSKSAPDREPASATSIYKERFRDFRECMNGLGIVPELERADEAWEMMARGREYLSASTQTIAGSQDPSLRSWFNAALREFPNSVKNDDPFKAGSRKIPLVAFFPGNPKQKMLSIQRSAPEKNDWNLAKCVDLEHREILRLELQNGGESAELSWHLRRDGKKIENARGLQVSYSKDGKNLEWRVHEKISWPNRPLELMVGNSEPSEEGWGRPQDELVFVWYTDIQTLVEKALPIVFDENRLDLVLQPLGTKNDPLEPIYPNPNRELKHPFLAIQVAPVRFSVAVRNKSPNLRRARVVLFELIGEKKTDLFRSKPVVLAPMGESQSQQIIEVDRSLTTEPRSNFAQNLGWRVEELESVPESAGSPRDPSLNDERPLMDKVWEFPWRFLPENPGLFIEIEKRLNKEYDKLVDQEYDLPFQLKAEFWNLVPPELSSVNTVVRWQDLNDSNLTGSYSITLSRKTASRLASQIEGPVLTKEGNRIRYMLDIEGYRRAQFVDFTFSDSSSRNPFEIRFFRPPSIDESVPVVFKAIANNHEPIPPVFEDGMQIVFPTMRWDNWNNKGDQKQPPTRYEIKGLLLEVDSESLGLDGQPAENGIGQVNWSLEQTQPPSDAKPREGSFADRDVIANNWKWEKSIVSFVPKLGEAKAEIVEPMLKTDSSAIYEFRLGLTESDRTSPWMKNLVLDREKPKPGKLKADSNELGPSIDSFPVRLVWENQEPDSGGAGLLGGLLAIRGPDQLGGNQKDRYDFSSKGKLKTVGVLKGKELHFDIKPDELEGLKKDLPPSCEIRINALVVDKAGNFQDTHESLTVRWNGSVQSPSR